MSSITLLGTGTCEIELERRAASALIKLDSLHVLFDCGHGVLQRLLEFGVQHKDIEHVVLSHFHPDHVSDLVPLFHAGAWIQIGQQRFEFVSLPPAGNHGLRFEWDGKRCAITGDSDFHEAEIAFLKDVDLAVIDAGHITDEQIIELAVVSQAKTIVCSHLYRDINVEHLQTHAEEQGYRGKIEVGQDLESYVI